MTRTAFLDLEFDTLTETEVEQWLLARNVQSAFAYVVTPNVDHMVRLADAPLELRRAYADADLCLCDSRVLARLARLTDVSLSVVPGSDLVATLFARVLDQSDRICLIGGSTEDAKRLAIKFPGKVLLHHSPPMGLLTDHAARAAAVSFSLAANARFTLLAVGSPQQELIAWEMKQAGTSAGTALCIGASIDFLIGTQLRAPKIVQLAGAEWAWRLLTQPRRLARRYLLVGPAIFPIVWRWRKAQRVGRI